MVASASAQDAKFGGPFSTLSYNKHGFSLSAGGGGTFFIKDNFYIGIFGQGTTDAFKRFGEKDHDDYLLKSRQTGFWLGYNHKLKNLPNISSSIYNKVGFGQVQLNSSEESKNYYDKTIVLTPNIELAYRFTSFFELGIAVYYEFYTGVNLFSYSANDFNSVGASILFKFKKSE